MSTIVHRVEHALAGARGRRRSVAVAAVAAITGLWSVTASAQLDPLLFLKRVPPNVLIIVDTSLSMLTEGNCSFSAGTCTLKDPGFWTTTDAAVLGAFVPPPTGATYRRKLVGFNYTTLHGNGNKQYTATHIDIENAAFNPATSTSIPASDLAFLDSTRYGIAKTAIAQAVSANATGVRWGLIRLRQATPSWALTSSPLGVSYVGGTDCAYYVSPTDPAQSGFGDNSPCRAAGTSFGIYIPSVATANYTQTNSGLLVGLGSSAASSNLLTIVNRSPGDVQGIVPTGIGGPTYEDRPLSLALDDAKTAIANQSGETASTAACRNTIVVLVTGGKDSGGSGYSANADTKASDFRAISRYGVSRPAPIHVIAIKPNPADDTVTYLGRIASNSGGTYTTATTTAAVTAAINRAVQTAFTRQADFDASRSSDFQPTSPIVGTVNLKNAADVTGAALPNTDIVASPGGQPLPQRSNVIITSGFALPGFDGRLRAFRTYKPLPDSTKPTGWKFVNDGTRLWPDLDGRPTLAGIARTPADPNVRNIYTYVPDAAGGGSVVPFTVANYLTLASHMNAGSDPRDLITYIRSQPLGAIVGSTPALMDPPSLDPPPDTAYGYSDAAGTFAGDHKDRRSIIFVGANDGMLHAIDARTGYEVWAFIPYNLLPKLRALQKGQPVEQYNYFVDSSPKIAEVKIGTSWRSIVIIGEGPGGTFYQAFDVTEAGMGVDPSQGDLTAVNALLARFDLPNESIQFKWAFPNYSSFDPTYTNTFTVTDGTPGGKVNIYGDLKTTAAYAEKTVGYTWSDPAVGALDRDRTVTAVMIGSGYFPDIEASLPGRGASAPKAGNAVYMVNIDTGRLIGNESAASCPQISNGSGSGTGCASIGDVSNGRKNAIQADPTAAGDGGSYIVNKAYVGDIDGKYWRFNFTSSGGITANLMLDTLAPIYASSALLFIGSVDVYMFFATGSDILPSAAPGGTGTFKLYGLKDNYPGSGATTQFSRNLTSVTNTNGVATGERPSTSPSVAGDIVFYTTTTESASTPCSDFTAKLYGLTYVGGAAYDADASGRIEQNESPVAKTVAGRATAPFIVDQHLYFGSAGTTGGASVEAFGDPEDFNNGIGQVGVRILSWREIR